MRERFKGHNFRQDSLNTIEQANQIIEEFEADGFTLTLRQLYYQFISKDLFPNTEQSYKRLGKLITKAREAGLVDWTAIEDRGRGGKTFYCEEDIYQLFEGMETFISFDMWAKQDHYVEVWVEKDALVNVVGRACDRYKVPYMACKGYLSASEAYRAGQRFDRARSHGKNCILIHLGDHDPSGMDMTRDNGNRLELFSRGDVEVKRIGLNMDQIEEYGPPPNPAKFEDPRASGYIEQYGQVSWELDALRPQVIDDLITENLRPLIDFDVWDEMKDDEELIRKKIRRLPGLTDEIFDLVMSEMTNED